MAKVDRDILECASRSMAAEPEWTRTNFGRIKESRRQLELVVEMHVREALKAARKLDMEPVVDTLEALLEGLDS